MVGMVCATVAGAMKQHTLTHNGESYSYTVELCMDSSEISISLDLGNGRPECVGYLPDDAEEADIVAAIREEIDRLSE